MILYLYRCRSCNSEIEHFAPLGHAPEAVTCDCQAEAKRAPGRGEFLTFPGAYKQP